MVKVPAHFKKFLKEEKFTLVQGRLFGRVDIYSNNNLTLRIVKDYNAFKSIEISSKIDTSRWLDLSILRSYSLGNDDYFDALDFEVGINFFIEYYKEICSLLDSNNYHSTVIKLRELAIKRSESEE